jgi:hypothetical protein
MGWVRSEWLGWPTSVGSIAERATVKELFHMSEPRSEKPDFKDVLS